MAGTILVWGTQEMRAVSTIFFAALLGLGLSSSLMAAENDQSLESLTEVIQTNCAVCHNDILRGQFADLSLQHYDVARAAELGPTTEKMIVKLRAGMMPPPGMPRPSEAVMETLVSTLENQVDRAAAENPNPGHRSFQRLNQAEYETAIKDLLALDINAADYLPLDTKSNNFDNIADVQLLSSTLLNSYMSAAAQISQLAIGDANILPASPTYTNSGYTSQWDRVEGAPFGTRGGISVVHNFPADGEYVFRMAFEHTTTGEYFGMTTRDQQIEISVDGERMALLDMDQWMHVSDPNGVNMKSLPIFVTAGPHRVSAVFLKQSEGPMQDMLSPHNWSLVDRQIGVRAYGITAPPHLKDLAIDGPYNTTGVSTTPSRQKIFSCRPTSQADEMACVEQILSRLAEQAYRGKYDASMLEDLISFYYQGSETGGFENGIKTALQAILASPDFVFRLEATPEDVQPGEMFRLAELDLASRLSYFLWGSPPDEELINLARSGDLSNPAVWDGQVERMLSDRRAEALGSRFAGQWLRLEDLEKVHPDRQQYPDYNRQLADAMRVETEMFFNYLVKSDRSALDLYTADFTFANEVLAEHYGIPDVAGDHFRLVKHVDDNRKGLLGHGSILTLTSHASRTSPVLRGKWVMEVLLGTPPPPPPPGVPDLEETEGVQDGRFLTTRERMEMHRSNPVCQSCHQFMDPIGLALDNFDVTGQWRIREHGMPLDTRGTFYSGAEIDSPGDLQTVLLSRPEPLLRNFTRNLMAYALGRRVEYYDMSLIRKIVKEAETNDYRMSAFIKGVVNSDAFKMKRIPEVESELETVVSVGNTL
jgi:hypothetical protein